MYTQMTRIIALLCAVALCLVGCQQQPKEDPSITESQLWETMPALTYGQMEYEKLKEEPWYCGRAEATGGNVWAEVDSGYYLSMGGYLRYSDRTAVLNWVPLCSKPNCSHTGHYPSCNAFINWDQFFIHDGRIYFVSQFAFYRDLITVKGDGLALFSKAMNGTDVKLEMLLEGAVATNGGFLQSQVVGPYWIHGGEKLNADGSCTAFCYGYNIQDKETETLFFETFPDRNDVHIDLTSSDIHGDRTVISNLLGTDYQKIANGQMVHTNAIAYAKKGDYLSGSILRQFRSNNGYYDINLETGEEVRLADAQLKNSQSFIVLPNCIIETTLGSENHQEGDAHAMMLFDGESWRTVALPEELTQIYTLDMPFEMGVVTSDRIYIMVYDSMYYDRCNMYQIMLGEEELTMEFCAELK